jgi:hypothetical protein
MDNFDENPIESLYREDLEHKFYSFCSYISMKNNKKMNIASIFIELIQDENLLDIFMNLCDHNTKYEAVRTFLTLEPSLQKSKYIKRFINKQNN